MIPVISKNAYKFFFPDNYLLIFIENCPMVPLEDRHGKLLILFTDGPVLCVSDSGSTGPLESVHQDNKDKDDDDDEEEDAELEFKANAPDVTHPTVAPR